jgi:hypothetical protein
MRFVLSASLPAPLAPEYYDVVRDFCTASSQIFPCVPGPIVVRHWVTDSPGKILSTELFRDLL